MSAHNTHDTLGSFKKGCWSLKALQLKTAGFSQTFRGDDGWLFANDPAVKSQRRQHGIGDVGGAVAAAELHWLDAAGISVVDRPLDALAGLSRRLKTVLVG